MRYLFAARHGAYEGEGDRDKDKLTSEGQTQIQNLGKKIKDIIQFNSICLASTNANRVVQSAEILQRELNIVDYFKVKERSQDLPLLYVAKKELYYAMIFVSHECPTAENASYVAARSGFNDKSVMNIKFFRGLGTGRALVLDLEQKTFTDIPEIKKVFIEPAKHQEIIGVDLAF